MLYLLGSGTSRSRKLTLRRPSYKDLVHNFRVNLLTISDTNRVNAT